MAAIEERLFYLTHSYAITRASVKTCTPYLANVVRCKTRLLEDGFDWLDAFVEE